MASRTGWLLWLDRLSITTRSPGASVGTSTSGRKALVDEHQLVRIEVELAFEPVLSLLQDVGAVLLGGVRGLLLEGQVVAIEEGPDRADAGAHASLLEDASPQFLERAVGLGLDRRQQDVAMR